MITTIIQTNPKLDLVLERVVDVPRELVGAAWTKPESHQEVVHARSVDHRRLRDRSSPGRHIPDDYAIARRAGVSPRGLLSRGGTE
jgi:hypothetical protein